MKSTFVGLTLLAAAVAGRGHSCTPCQITEANPDQLLVNMNNEQFDKYVAAIKLLDTGEKPSDWDLTARQLSNYASMSAFHEGIDEEDTSFEPVVIDMNGNQVIQEISYNGQQRRRLVSLMDLNHRLIEGVKERLRPRFPDFFIPIWNFTAPNALNLQKVFSRSRFGNSVDVESCLTDGKFANFGGIGEHCTVRVPYTRKTSLPSRMDVKALRRGGDDKLFNKVYIHLLESLYDELTGEYKGSFAYYDPLFLSVYAYLDLFWKDFKDNLSICKYTRVHPYGCLDTVVEG